MQDMLTPIFGDTGAIIVQYAITLAVIAILVALVIWGVRRFGSAVPGPAVRGRQPRLAVIDTLPVDARRRLVLLRRDNVEHLILIGGPVDVVVEPTIVRQRVAQRPGQVTAARSGAGETRQTTELPSEDTTQPAESLAPVRAVEPVPAPEDTAPRFSARRPTPAGATRPEPPRRESMAISAPPTEMPVRRYRAVAPQPETEAAAEAAPRRETARAEMTPRRPEPRSEPGTSRYTSPLRPLADDASESVPGYEPTEADTTPASAFAPQSHAEPEETRAGEIAATAENVEQTETDAPAEDASDLEKEMARLLGQISTTRRE